MAKVATGHLMMVAGEASGDLYGGHLARALSSRCPNLRITGIGGKRMSEEGIALFASSEEMAVVGLVEVLSHWRPIRRAFRETVSRLESDPPDLLILIDYPGFNLRLARIAHRLGIPILYFISPQIWAWRASRIKQIARYVHRMLVILPFEEEIYARAGVSVRYVGHPLLDLLPSPSPTAEGKRRHGLDPERPVLGLLPGSRLREVEFHFPTMIEAAKRLHRAFPGLQVVVPRASTLRKLDFDAYLGPETSSLPSFHLVASDPGEALTAMDVAVVKSGTATLEAALMGIPMVVVYRTTAITHGLASWLARIDRIGLVNIVAGRDLVPELIQRDYTARHIVEHLQPLLADEKKAAAVREQLISLRQQLGSPGCFERAADEVTQLLADAPRVGVR